MQQSLEQVNKLGLTNMQVKVKQGAISKRFGILTILYLGINMISTIARGRGKGSILEWSHPKS